MRGDIVGARGKVKLADASGIFISLGDLQESGLFLERDSGKGAAEEGKLDLLRLKGFDTSAGVTSPARAVIFFWLQKTQSLGQPRCEMKIGMMAWVFMNRRHSLFSQLRICLR